jgi:hypothetical protein
MIAYIIITAVLLVASVLFVVYMLTRGRAWTPGEQTTAGGKIRDTLKNVL